MLHNFRDTALALLAMTALAACQKPATGTSPSGHDGAAAKSDAGNWTWRLPAGFPVPFVPADNPMSEAKFQLGRRLFFDKRLSGNGTQACGSCHLQRLAFTDGRAVAVGSTGEHTARGAMSIVNAVYYPTLTWANPSQFTLEIQAKVPMFVDNIGIELGINEENKAQVLARFTSDPAYPAMFRAAFPESPDSIDFDHIVMAISTFERGLIAGNSRYDQAQQGQLALNAAEERGRRLFFSAQGQCSQCHSGFNFSDQTYDAATRHVLTPFHNTGLYNTDGRGAYPRENPGLIAVMPQAENMGKFRVPTLRNIAVTAPYIHDGSVPDLKAVLDIYAAHGRKVTAGPNRGDGRRSPLKDPRIDRIRLGEQDKQDLIAFLETLTDRELLSDPRFSDPFASKDTP